MDFLTLLKEEYNEDTTKVESIINEKNEKTFAILEQAFDDAYATKETAIERVMNEFTDSNLAPKDLDTEFLTTEMDYIVETIKSLTEGEIKIIINNDIDKSKNGGTTPPVTPTVSVDGDMEMECAKPKKGRGRPKKVVEPVEEDVVEEMACPKCEAMMAIENKHCSDCGSPMVQDQEQEREYEMEATDNSGKKVKIDKEKAAKKSDIPKIDTKTTMKTEEDDTEVEGPTDDVCPKCGSNLAEGECPKCKGEEVEDNMKKDSDMKTESEVIADEPKVDEGALKWEDLEAVFDLEVEPEAGEETVVDADEETEGEETEGEEGEGEENEGQESEGEQGTEEEEGEIEVEGGEEGAE